MTTDKIQYEANQDELVKLRRHFHAWPELSLEEKETAEYVEQYLKNLGLQTRRVGKYGITAMVWAHEKIRNNCKTIGVRAEMDAIAVKEENGVPWKSQRDGNQLQSYINFY